MENCQIKGRTTGPPLSLVAVGIGTVAVGIAVIAGRRLNHVKPKESLTQGSNFNALPTAVIHNGSEQEEPGRGQNCSAGTARKHKHRHHHHPPNTHHPPEG